MAEDRALHLEFAFTIFPLSSVLWQEFFLAFEELVTLDKPYLLYSVLYLKPEKPQHWGCSHASDPQVNSSSPASIICTNGISNKNAVLKVPIDGLRQQYYFGLDAFEDTNSLSSWVHKATRETYIRALLFSNI